MDTTRTVVSQSRLSSLIESLSNTALGYITSLMTWYLIIWSGLFDINMTLGENLVITFIFTATSILRGYCVRRFYNWRINK